MELCQCWRGVFLNANFVTTRECRDRRGSKFEFSTAPRIYSVDTVRKQGPISDYGGVKKGWLIL